MTTEAIETTLVTTNEPGQRAQRVRTCVGCGKEDAPGALLRVVLGPVVLGKAEVAVDIRGGADGRGAHVHPAADCLAKACKSGLARSFKTGVEADVTTITRQITDAYDRRISGLLLGAYRARLVALGADAACDALVGGAPLAVVACDAGRIAESSPVRAAVAAGRAVSWGNKQTLGALFGEGEIGLIAIKSSGVAEQIREARSRSEGCKRPVEVRREDR